jgi:hypothetical protein
MPTACVLVPSEEAVGRRFALTSARMGISGSAGEEGSRSGGRAAGCCRLSFAPDGRHHLLSRLPHRNIGVEAQSNHDDGSSSASSMSLMGVPNQDDPVKRQVNAAMAEIGQRNQSLASIPEAPRYRSW